MIDLREESEVSILKKGIFCTRGRAKNKQKCKCERGKNSSDYKKTVRVREGILFLLALMYKHTAGSFVCVDRPELLCFKLFLDGGVA